MTYSTMIPTNESPETCLHGRRTKFDSHRCFDCGTSVQPTPVRLVDAAVARLDDGPLTVLMDLSVELYRDGWPVLSDRVLDLLPRYRSMVTMHLPWSERRKFLTDALLDLVADFR